MMLYLLPALPLVVGLLLAVSFPLVSRTTERRRRASLGAVAVATLAGTVALAGWAAGVMPRGELSWGGGLVLTLAVDPLSRVVALLVPSVATPVVLWAAAHEEDRGLPRLLGGLVAFVGAMELLVLAADLLVLLVGWELVGALSFLLIAHRHRDDGAVESASYAFNATRLGGLGLFLAAGAALGGAGSFALDDLSVAAEGRFGDLLAAGVLLAAASKSAQLPFSPWLMRAMVGPSAVSALLHSSTMVAAGAWLLIRLHEPLAPVPWLGPAAVGIGLATALVGGLAAAAQGHAKRLLAASTSAQYGLMFAAVGAGAAGAALAHLVAHAALKALLFLVAGTAMTAVGTGSLGRMRLGRALPFAAVASSVGALALAAVPPLGAAWSKEMVVAATSHLGAPVALLTIAAGGLTAFYAGRFHLLAFGRGDGDGGAHPTGTAERIAFASLALTCLGLSVLWLPSVHGAAARWTGTRVPEGSPWELPVSAAVVAVALATAWIAVRRRRGAEERRGARAIVASWLGLPWLVERLVTRPALALADLCARFDDRVVDAGVRGAAWLGPAIARGARTVLERGVDAAVDGVTRLALWTGDGSRAADDRGIDAGVEGVGRGVGLGGRYARRLQTGAVPFYYALAVGGLFVIALVLWLARSFG